MNFKIILVLAMLIACAMAACKRHGDPCVSESECCTNMRCNRFANRCQVIITPEELMAQREKILNRNRNRDSNH